MSNSSRIEAATRQHVGATLTSEQIVELVKMSDPNWKGGVYPSDAAYTRTPEGLVPRGKTAYGDGVLEYLAANSFKVLKTEEIVRRPGGKKPAAAPVAVASAPAPVETKPVVAVRKGKKPTGKASQIPVATKQKANDRHAAQ
jgi:hypothetical protein